MSFIEGFLGGFADTGSKILQAQDEREQRIRELVMKGDEQIRVNNAKIKADAEEARKAREEIARANEEFLYGKPRMSSDTTSPSILQMAEEPDIMDDVTKAETVTSLYGTEVPPSSPFTGLSTISPQDIPTEYFEMYKNDPRMVEKGMKAFMSDRRMEQRYNRADTKAADAEEARNVRFETQLKEGKNKEVRSAWAEVETNKNHPMYTILNNAAKANSILPIIRQAKKANDARNIRTSVDAVASTLLPMNVSANSKALEKAGSEDVKAMADAWSGAISNFETAYFQSLAVSPDNKWEVNASRLAMLEVGAARASQFAKFALAAKNKGIPPLDAGVIWREYLNDQDAKSPTVKYDNKKNYLKQLRSFEDITKDDSWKTQLGMEPTTKRQIDPQTSPTTMQDMDKEKARIRDFLGGY